jgi:hypothetical protein
VPQHSRGYSSTRGGTRVLAGHSSTRRGTRVLAGYSSTRADRTRQQHRRHEVLRPQRRAELHPTDSVGAVGATRVPGCTGYASTRLYGLREYDGQRLTGRFSLPLCGAALGRFAPFIISDNTACTAPYSAHGHCYSALGLRAN